MRRRCLEVEKVGELQRRSLSVVYLVMMKVLSYKICWFRYLLTVD